MIKNGLILSSFQKLTMHNNQFLTYQWQPYNGNYQKKIQDIKLKNGDIVTRCYPNAGFWNPTQKKGNEKYYGTEIPHTEAEFVKLSE